MAENETIHTIQGGMDQPPAPHRSQWLELWLPLRRNRMAMAGMIIFILFFVVAIGGLLLTSGSNPVFNPAMVRLQEQLRPPLALPRPDLLQPHEVPRLGMYLLGTDDLGRDVFARMLQGAWISLTVGFVAVGIAVAIGIFLGGLAGFYGQSHIRFDHILLAAALSAGGILLGTGRPVPGTVSGTLGILYALYLWHRKTDIGTAAPPPQLRPLHLKIMTVDTLIMRMVDIMLCFPSFFLVLTVVALLPASIYNIMIVIGLTSWMGSARFVRAEFLSLREQDFVTAARALGINNFRIIFRHMMPNAIAPVLVSATIGIAGAILTEAGLSFLGFGVPPPHATWGNILSDGKRFIFDAPWLTFIPGIFILVVVLAFNLFGDGLRDVFNPKLRERH